MDCQNGCLDCNDDPVHAWDEAVAFYSGSLEGVSGSDSGVLLYRLAEKRCKNFGTCGDNSVNGQIMREFTRGKNKLLSGNCFEVIPIKRRIVQLMSVPLVQGSLRYAYKVDRGAGTSKERAEGEAFSAAILPRVAACDTSASTTIANNLAYTASTPMGSGFKAVKGAFEFIYSCLGITCEDVGGIVQAQGKYFVDAEPCVTVAVAAEVVADDSDDTVLIIVIVAVAVFAAIMISVALFCAFRARSYQKILEEKETNNHKMEDVEPQTIGNQQS